MISDPTLLLSLFAFSEAPVPWWDYPGLEIWKFVNLGLFIFGLLYLVKRPLTDALRSRQASIRRELDEARQEKEAALAKLAAVEKRLQGLDAEVSALDQKSRLQAQAELARIQQETDKDMAVLRDQAHREIENAGKVARQELRRFAAQQSVRFAEESVRREIRPDDEARLIQRSVAQLGGS